MNRTLSVSCYAGLGNRLRVLISRLAIAEASGRQLKFCRPRTESCGASFTKLFDGELDCVEAEPAGADAWRTYGDWFDPPLPD